MGSCNCSVPSQSRAKNPLKIAYGNGIFACWPMFSYGQRSKCADLLNSYGISILNRRASTGLVIDHADQFVGFNQVI